MEVDKKAIFITGATGFVGAWLVRYFAERGWSVTASGRGAAPAPLLERAAYLRADLSRPLPILQTDVVVHAAALASDSALMADLQAANVDGTRHVFEATRHCKIFIYISSASVYDYQKTTHTENEPVDYQQLSSYGRSKRQAEDWLKQQDWHDRTLVILRPRALYGPGDRVLLPRLLRLVRSHRMMIPGTLRVQSSLTHVE
ncbi:MAG: NAD(P)-dependent oxidoreductase, partial [Saprospiraceae bacterium]|nr:NAD(P)-dependent oxidoreductase [Saprospiraceae bacterium]